MDGKIHKWPAASDQRIRGSKRWLSCSDSNREALVVSCAFWRLSMNACPEAQAGGANRADSACPVDRGWYCHQARRGSNAAHSRRPSWCLVVSPFGINSWAAGPRGTSAHTVDSNQQPSRSRSALAGQRRRRRFPRSTVHLPFFPLSLSVCPCEHGSGPWEGSGYGDSPGKREEGKCCWTAARHGKKEKVCLGAGPEVKAATG